MIATPEKITTSFVRDRPGHDGLHLTGFEVFQKHLLDSNGQVCDSEHIWFAPPRSL